MQLLIQVVYFSFRLTKVTKVSSRPEWRVPGRLKNEKGRTSTMRSVGSQRPNPPWYLTPPSAELNIDPVSIVITLAP